MFSLEYHSAEIEINNAKRWYTTQQTITKPLLSLLNTINSQLSTKDVGSCKTQVHQSMKL